jgi:hypothetical protein
MLVRQLFCHLRHTSRSWLFQMSKNKVLVFLFSKFKVALEYNSLILEAHLKLSMRLLSTIRAVLSSGFLDAL